LGLAFVSTDYKYRYDNRRFAANACSHDRGEEAFVGDGSHGADRESAVL